MNDMIESMMPKNEDDANRVLVWLVVGIIAFALAVRFCA